MKNATGTDTVMLPGETALVPHSYGSLLQIMVSVYRKNAGRILSVAAVGYALSFLIGKLITFTAIPRSPYIEPPFFFLGGVLLKMCCFVMLLSILNAVENAIIASIAVGQFVFPIRIKEALAMVWKRIGTLLLCSFLFSAAFLGLCFSIVGFPFAVYLVFSWTFFVPVAVIERHNAVRSLSRSRMLVRKSWWRISGIVFSVILVIGLVGLAFFSIPFVRDAVAVVLRPGYAIIIALLYLDMRVRKEGYNEAMLKKDLGMED